MAEGLNVMNKKCPLSTLCKHWQGCIPFDLSPSTLILALNQGARGLHFGWFLMQAAEPFFTFKNKRKEKANPFTVVSGEICWVHWHVPPPLV